MEINHGKRNRICHSRTKTENHRKCQKSFSPSANKKGLQRADEIIERLRKASIINPKILHEPMTIRERRKMIGKTWEEWKEEFISSTNPCLHCLEPICEHKFKEAVDKGRRAIILKCKNGDKNPVMPAPGLLLPILFGAVPPVVYGNPK